MFSVLDTGGLGDGGKGVGLEGGWGWRGGKLVGKKGGNMQWTGRIGSVGVGSETSCVGNKKRWR